jgi:hypothetical protein
VVPKWLDNRYWAEPKSSRRCRPSVPHVVIPDREGRRDRCYPSSKVVTPKIRSNRPGGIAPLYMRAASNTGASPKSCAQRDPVAVDARNVEECLAAARAAQQSRQHHVGAGTVVGQQRADLTPVSAWTDHAPTGKSAIAHERAPQMSRRADPGAQERRSRNRENRRVVRLHRRQWMSVSAMTPACATSGTATMPS